MDIHPVVELLKSLALGAGKIQKERIFDSIVEFKEGEAGKVPKNDLGAAVVSSVDREIQDVVLQRMLDEGYDDWKIFAEEDTPLVDEFSEKSPYSLFLDPVDGTLNYLLSNPENEKYFTQLYGKMDDHPYHFGFVAGIAKNMRMEAIVIYSTTTKSLCWAIRGEGAFCNGERIHVSSEVFAQEEEFFINSKDHDLDLLPNGIRSHCTNFAIIRVGTGEDLCYITYTCSLHDTIPCSLFITEAGGVMVDSKGNHFDKINPKRDIQKHWYLCNSIETYHKLRELEKDKE